MYPYARGLALSSFAILVALLAACGPSEVAMFCTPYADDAGLAERPSPFDSTMVSIDSAQAKICYSRPFARERVVFGGLVPWDTLWRTGANEPTIIYLNRDAEIAGLPVDAGKYSIYTMPNQEQWQVVVNASTGQWGQTRDTEQPDGTISGNSYTSDVESEEVGRASIGTEPIEYTDQFTTSFGVPDGSGVNIYFDWETTRIVVPLRFVIEGS